MVTMTVLTCLHANKAVGAFKMAEIIHIFQETANRNKH